MKTERTKKLLLNRETLRNLQDLELRRVVGGRVVVPPEGHWASTVLTGSPCIACHRLTAPCDPPTE